MRNQYYYLSTNVLEESLERIRWVYEEFDEVVVTVSGGKDSTVVLNLAHQVAASKGRLPVKVFFIDQEAEWDLTIEYMRYLQSLDWVKLYWFQFDFELPNCTSSFDRKFIAWEPCKQNIWIRQKEPGALHENVYGITDWYTIFAALIKHHFPKQKACYIGGVRAEESLNRKNGLTQNLTYKWATWGRRNTESKDNYITFYPIYDWSWRDVWKYIHDNALPYNQVYDYQYQYGIPINEMRVSSLTHETAIKNLFYLPEVSTDLYNRLSARLSGISTISKSRDQFLKVGEMPYMFRNWAEYRDYLLINIVVDATTNKKISAALKAQDKVLGRITNLPKQELDRVYKSQISAILANDGDLTKLKNLALHIGKLKHDYH